MRPGKTSRRPRPATPVRHRGFTYLGVLFLVTLMGLGLAGSFQAWSTAAQRARERELLWIGTQYARAIQAYYLQSPGTRQYPLKLEELVEDKRFPATRHHLRKRYPDPLTRSDDWGLIKTQDSRIAGIYSKAEGEPWKKAKFPLRWEDFTDKTKYSEWRFVADVGLLGEARPAAGVANPAQQAPNRR
ncbi:MAG: type II secretion system protein [Dechloromonas sp.]|nr:type II secretion system protein [Dechloromonas sp.]